ncbi:MAG: hypothetical protein COX46_02325 [bacterium (Candidatus Ratteibacteria) CG23_combo_of_CG06-09_8_20_14_all_48_7]|uniref:Polymerase beta nucleotidyltransferase domain-containing protein n=1 Tax=bacterium (Candidatus Ratteibacteria) CG23_combo_of_CG06-09_8_20_14_all_48_7 TaxID=2014292 RepID=A0A2G9YB24_9BACT|nr:MAG: hypothetical protein COX46_02325 [bacterium (Candidatus Ratteibacteria) CG23_combo_of_CG06-09_8_20_14_all_48_7]
MKREELIFALKKFFREKAEFYHVDIVLLFGSWYRGYPKEESDIDIAVIFDDSFTSEEEIYELITNISVNVSENFGKDVNTIPIYPDFRKPMLYYNAIIAGEPVYIRNSSKYITYRMKAIFHMEDFSLFGVKWQLERTSRNLEELRYA